MAKDETYFERGREYYKATNSPVWPSRLREHPSAKPGDQQHLGPLIEDSYVQFLLKGLDELEKKTRPSLGTESAKQKDLAAFEALKTVASLAEYVAG